MNNIIKQHLLLACAFFCFMLTGVRAAEINEILFEYSGSGYGFIELYGTPGESLDNKSLVMVAERYINPGYTQGVIRKVLPLSGYYFESDRDFFVIGDSSRFPDEIDYVTGYLSAPGEAITLLLANEFTGEVGQDLDADDDGVFDTTPWASLDHIIGYRSINSPPGNLVYATPFLDYVFFDGLYRPNDTGNLLSRSCGYGGSPGEPNEGPNPPPTDILADPEILSVAEDAPLNRFICSFSLVDDAPSSSRFFLIDDPSGFFSLTSYNGRLVYRNLSGMPLDASVTPSFDIDVLGQDCYGNWIIKTFTINVVEGSAETQLIASNETGSYSFHEGSISLTLTQNSNANGFDLIVGPLNSGQYNQIAPGATAIAPDGTILQPDTVSRDAGWEASAPDLEGTLVYSLSFDYTGVSGIGDPDKLVILYRPDEYTPWSPVDTTRAGNKLTASGLINFGEFAIGSDSAINPLPINASLLELEG